MKDKERGVYQKYHVTRVDGKYPDSIYFVLRDGDPLARWALLAYAIAAWFAGYRRLSADIIKRYHVLP